MGGGQGRKGRGKKTRELGIEGSWGGDGYKGLEQRELSLFSMFFRDNEEMIFGI